MHDGCRYNPAATLTCLEARVVLLWFRGPTVNSRMPSDSNTCWAAVNILGPFTGHTYGEP